MNLFTVVAEIEKRAPELFKLLPELFDESNQENRDTVQYMAYRLGILETYLTGRVPAEWR